MSQKREGVKLNLQGHTRWDMILCIPRKIEEKHFRVVIQDPITTDAHAI